MSTDRLNKMRMELRRGILVLVVLSSLQEEHYGYSLRKKLIAAGIDIDEGTLYPLIRRLESYELLTSEWREGEGRKKRYYKISTEGHLLLIALRNEWQEMNESMSKLLEDQA